MEDQEEKLSYLQHLLSYVIGVRREEVETLVQRYMESGGGADPAQLFAFLTANGRQYMVFWCAFPHTDQISILLGAVLAPDKRVLWWSIAPVPYNKGSGALRVWNRVLELVSGMGTHGTPKVSEGDWWAAEQLARQCGGFLPEMIGLMLGELELATGGFSNSSGANRQFFEDSNALRGASVHVEKRMREAIGRNISLSVLRVMMVSLPELRDLGLEIQPLQNALDGYVDSALGEERREEETEENRPAEEGAASVILPEAGVRLLDPVVDPVNGVPLSDVYPGDVLLLERRGFPKVPGRVYMIRVLKNGQYEIYGRVEGEETFFRSVVHGDIKVELADGAASGPRTGLSGITRLFWGVLVLGLVAVFLLLFFLWR
ncbi:hypothetical protein [Aminiphilus sp.]|uniref:hypothetical protein n=1 Tax=Aminiphilus sp. TaxID=1872488 RepID=UPI002635F334|nr:hypothetical protein [Aminiphilus sp.]